MPSIQETTTPWLLIWVSIFDLKMNYCYKSLILLYRLLNCTKSSTYWFISLSNSATVYLSTRYKETMAVKLSLNGRAPIVVTDHHVAMLDRSAYTVNIYQYDNQKFPSVSTTADGEVKHIIHFSKLITVFNSKW